MQKFIFLACLAGSVLLGACHGGMVRKGLTQAEAGMAAVAGENAAPLGGRVSFVQIGDRVRVIAEMHGLPPGAYGLDLLPAGDCSTLPAAATGAELVPSGGMNTALDDMPALIANSQGVAKLSAYLDAINLDNDKEAIDGRQIVIRAGTGGTRAHKIRNVGKIVACGVINAR